MRQFFILMLMLASTTCFASEADHVRRLAPKYDAAIEVPLWDGTRVDLLSDNYAYEVDFAPKWAEGVGQALYYGQLTGRRPGLILLTQRDQTRFAYRAQTTAARGGVDVFIEWVEPRTMPSAVGIEHNPLVDDLVKPTDLRAYMVQHKDERWLRRTVPGQINIWFRDQGSASIWTNKQEAHRVWLSLGFGRDFATIKTFMLIPIEDK